jgi:hypothetical protein
MPRKKQITDNSAENETTGAATAVADAEAQADAARAMLPRPDYIDGPPLTADGKAITQTDPEAKNWGPAYKAIFTCTAKGFEMGEDRRFKQRLFKFVEKPEEHVLAALKEHGFTYRASEKAWTVNATAENRVLTDRLAQEFAGVEQGVSR